MSFVENNYEIVPSNKEIVSESQGDDSIKVTGKDDWTRREMLKIRDLDMSIRELEIELKIARAETMDLQSKNREELKKRLLLEPPETAIAAKNTRKFLDLFDEFEENQTLARDIKKSEPSKLQSIEHENSSSIADSEEKKRLDLVNDAINSIDETSINQSTSVSDINSALNPFRIDESSEKMLQEIDDRLKENSHDC